MAKASKTHFEVEPRRAKCGFSTTNYKSMAFSKNWDKVTCSRCLHAMQFFNKDPKRGSREVPRNG